MTALKFGLTSLLPLFLRRQNRLRYQATAISILACSLFAPVLAHADAVVTEPTEAALDAAFVTCAKGGTITFACDGTIPITSAKKIAVVSPSTTSFTVTLDATGHNIILDGGGNTTLFSATGRHVSHPDNGVNPPSATYTASLVFKHLTLTDSGNSAVTASYGSVTATDCAFTNNASPSNGGAISVSTQGNVSLTNCAFLNNQSGGSGGAIAALSGTLSKCVFQGNAASGPGGTSTNKPSCNGGAVYLSSNSVGIANCAFLNNRLNAGAYSSVNGGALMLALPLNSAVTNCTFSGNSATSGSNNDAHGGAFYANTGSSYSCTLTNCTFSGNVAQGGQGGTGMGGGMYNGLGKVTLVNTIVADNRSDDGKNASGIALTDGGHNLCSDASCGFTVASSLNNTDARLGPLVYPGNATPTLSLLGGSPAIDAGDDSKAPATDQRGATLQGSHRDIGAYERPLWQADAVATDANNNTVLLWNHNQGYMCLWNVNSNTGGLNTQWLYGPYAGWTATDIAVGADNHARILWKHVNGQVNVWSVDMATGTPLYEREYPAQPGWTGAAISVGGDGNTRLAWRSPQGSVRLWTLDETTGAKISDTLLTMFGGWSFVSMATGTDNITRLLWNHASGQENLNSVDRAGNVTAFYTYGPFAGWTATRLSVGADSQTRLLWNHVQGYQSLWSVNNSNGDISQQTLYNIYPGWNSLSLATGRDNATRLLWNHVGGQQSFWNVDSAFNILIQPGYGPYY